MGKLVKRDEYIVVRLIIFFFFCGEIIVKLEIKFKIVLMF